MISATELRIGNIVNDEFTTVIGIHTKDNVMLYRSSLHPEGERILPCKIEELKPVKLTEEWLLKFGFLKRRSSGHKDNDFEYEKNEICFSCEDIIKRKELGIKELVS